MGLFFYFCYSMWQLIRFHWRLLKTGNLTKEDIGRNAQNFSYTAMYNRFGRMANLMQIRKN